ETSPRRWRNAAINPGSIVRRNLVAQAPKGTRRTIRHLLAQIRQLARHPLDQLLLAKQCLVQLIEHIVGQAELDLQVRQTTVGIRSSIHGGSTLKQCPAYVVDAWRDGHAARRRPDISMLVLRYPSRPRPDRRSGATPLCQSRIIAGPRPIQRAARGNNSPGRPTCAAWALSMMNSINIVNARG